MSKYQNYERPGDTVRRLAEEMARGVEREREIGSAAYWAEQYEKWKRNSDAAEQYL